MEKLGYAQFFITDPATGNSLLVNNRNYLTVNQEKMMSSQPDMILQFAHFLDAEAKKNWGIDDAIVTAEVYVSLNGDRKSSVCEYFRRFEPRKRNVCSQALDSSL